MNFLESLVDLHHRVFSSLQRATAGWFLGALARLVFVAVLLLYYWNSAWGKLGSGISGLFTLDDGAYFSILGEGVLTAYDFETANVPFYLDAVVLLGTWTELLLPLMIVLGLFTRIAALGMMFFIFVQSYVDIAVHKVGESTIGALFDRHSESVIMDQRALWMFLLIVLVMKGADYLSLDYLLRKWWQGRTTT